MPQLTIYKASAGSGKTWRLTVEYLKLLLQNPGSYRNILAVTFTNKATGEMKERVLSSLYELMTIDTSAEPEDMLKAICEELSFTPEKIRSQAVTAMSFLLHDYGHFRIETIDSFFQSVLRNLARELGLGAWLNIELDNSKVLGDAVEAMIDKSANNPVLLGWMTDYMEEMVEEGKSWKIDTKLRDFGKTIFKEYFKEKEKELEIKLSDKNFLKKYKHQLKELENHARKQMEQPADEYFSILESHGLTIDDINGKASGPSSFFIKLKRGECDPSISEGTRVKDCMTEPEKWAGVKHTQRDTIISLASEKLMPLLNKAEQIREKYYPVMLSSSLASSHLNKVGLLTDISSEVRELNRENNRFLLSDTNALLKSLLNDGDTSFVYEKTGAELNHILFDEFQDTSRMQWDTFRPLLAEGLANGFESFIVGDEKQSIYRWRNGDWRILGNIANEMIPYEVNEYSLKKNWRSERNIIDFNNAIFGQLERNINKMHSEQFGTESPELTKAYSDVRQESGKKDNAGLVEISFIKKNKDSNYDELALDRLVRKVEELQRSGIRPGQIAILIRVNRHIPRIGEYFASFKASGRQDPDLCYDIVSDDAFLLESSKAVQIIIDALRLLNDPLNPISQSLLKLDFQKDVMNFSGELNQVFRHIQKYDQKYFTDKKGYKKHFTDSNPEASLLPEEFINNFDGLQRMPLYELAEELYRLFRLDRIPAQDSYLYCFMDKLSEYLLHGSSDIASFLSHWDEKMCKTSIPAGSAVNGIRILSIHKSKGLEFHTVIIPFCNWSLLSDQKYFQIWCQPETEPFNQLDLLPVDYNKELRNSIFSREYGEETLQLWVDSLNLLYVAFTRTKHNLIVFCQEPENRKEDKKPANIGNLLHYTLKQGPDEGNIIPENIRLSYIPESSEIGDEGTESVTEAFFRFGELSIDEESTSSKNEGIYQNGQDIPLPFRSFAQKTRFKQSNRSIEFSKGRDPEGYSSSYIDRGKLLHRLFSDIRRREDISSAMNTLLGEGIITSSEAILYRDFVEKAICHPDVSDWYSDKYKLFNECSILCSGTDGKHQLKRPDRVMLSSTCVKVVDFKFGKPSGKYRRQIQEYMKLLRDMGYATVEGYLWYVDEERVEKVSS